MSEKSITPLDNPLRERIKRNLTDFDVIERTAEKSAAVALIVVELGYGADLPGMDSYSQWQQAPALLLTTRSRKLRNHPGQWALPGGRIDQGETALVAAKREALEEIDLVLNSDALLGRLDDFVTRSGFVMSPVVFWGGKAESLKPNPDEVDSIHRIPVAELMREDSPILDHDEVGDDEATIESTDSQNRPVLRMPIGEHWIAAPTAAVLYQFREVCILGKATRVAHFDQPRFAWK